MDFHVRAVIELDGLGPKVDPYGQVVRVLEPVIDELQQEARLAHGRLPNDYVLEDVLVAHNLVALLCLHGFIVVVITVGCST